MRGNVDKQCIEKILSYCDRAEALLQKCNRDYETFLSDEFFLSLSMIEMQIGEITGHLSEDFKNETKNQMPWHMMKSMRNMFAHVYDDMDSKIIWDTAMLSLPELKAFCEEYLKENPDE